MLLDLQGVDGLKECAEAIGDVWPDAVVEDTAAREFAHGVDALLPTEESELCVYRDLDAARRWQHGGVRDETHNSMIQISLVPGGVRLIADDWSDPALRQVLERLSRSGSPSRPRASLQAADAATP
jgi:hypothetical protein